MSVAMCTRSLQRVQQTLLLTLRLQHRCATEAASSGSEVIEEVQPWKAVPGPSSLPVIGQIHHFLPRGSLYKLECRSLADKLYEEYGPIVRINAAFGRPNLLYLYDPTSIAMIQHASNLFPRRPTFQTLDYYRINIKNMKEGTMGLLSDQCEGWKKFRSIVNPVLLQPKTIKLYEAQIDQVADEMILRMKSKLDENGMIKENLLNELNLWALESIGTIALGGRLGCLDPSLPPDSLVFRLIQCVEDIFTKFDSLNYGLSIWRYYPTKKFKEAMQAYEEQHKITKVLIEKAKKQFQNESKAESEKGVLQKLLEIDEHVAHVTVNDMLLAGVDTTSNTIINTMYYLATNPDTQEILREEVLSGKSRNYLRACLKESLRLMPVTSTTLRQTTKDHVLMGYHIPKDTMVFMCHHRLTLDARQFPRPRAFLPARWLPPSQRSAEPFVYNPFGFGVRSCIGKRIADMEMETLLTKIIRNFKLDWFGPPLNIEPHFINTAKPPFNFKYTNLT